MEYMSLWITHTFLRDILDELCTVISDQLIERSLLPGLQALHIDLEKLSPDEAPIIASMIQEFESKVQASRPSDR